MADTSEQFLGQITIKLSEVHYTRDLLDNHDIE